MCFLTEIIESKKLVFVFVAMTVVFTSYKKIEIIQSDLSGLSREFEYKEKTHLESMKVLKKTVERLREELRESEAAMKKTFEELSIYKADKTGLADYAYKGRVTPTRGTQTYESAGVSFFGMSICGQTYVEGRIVDASVMPGDCWPIKGQQGSAMIELIDEINVNKITLEHAPKRLLPNGTSSAPKEFSLLGLPEGQNRKDTPHFFGRFAFSLASSEVQTFAVQIPTSETFKRVEVQVHSNHGHSEFTCLYRVRIHGNKK